MRIWDPDWMEYSTGSVFIYTLSNLQNEFVPGTKTGCPGTCDQGRQWEFCRYARLDTLKGYTYMQPNTIDHRLQTGV